jgi:hypothetical protein
MLIIAHVAIPDCREDRSASTPTEAYGVRPVVRDGAAWSEGFVFDDRNCGAAGDSYGTFPCGRLRR